MRVGSYVPERHPSRSACPIRRFGTWPPDGFVREERRAEHLPTDGSEASRRFDELDHVERRAFVALAPERLVWGSDWPHVTEAHKPDDAALLDLLADWAGDGRVRNRILADNPATLYGFA